MAAITVQDLTQGELKGTGVFDELMRSTKAHLSEEYSKGHIKGSEYATVYLGALQSVMSQSLQFLLQQQQVDLQAQLSAEQIESEGLNQLQIKEQTLNLVTTRDQITEQTAMIVQQTSNLVTENERVEAQTELVVQQKANEILQGKVLIAQECKLRGEFDLIAQQRLKTVSETALLSQKKVTEQAQTSGAGIDIDSVIGRQVELYTAQRDGYRRDAEQKAAKLLADSWNVRKTMDGSGTDATPQNRLTDENIGAAIEKMLQGINAQTVF